MLANEPVMAFFETPLLPQPLEYKCIGLAKKFVQCVYIKKKLRFCYTYRFIYKTHPPPLRWEELGKIEEVEKGAQKKWRGGEAWRWP